MADHKQPKVPWGPHDSLWIAEAKGQAGETQLVDLQAQIGLFLLQTSSVPGDGEVRDRVVEYLRRTFRWRGVEDPDTEVYDVYNHLLTHKWWLDDRRAWRKYVRGCIKGIIRSQRDHAARVLDTSPDEQGFFTVDQFARACGISRSTAYDWIQNGTVPAVRGKVKDKKYRRYMISADAVGQVTPAGLSRSQRANLMAVLKNRGRKEEAARKWISRREQSGRSFVEIAKEVMTLKPRG